MRNKKFFSEIFLQILKSKGYFETFEKKNMTLKAYVFPKLQTAKTWLEKSLKSPVSEHPLIVNILKGPKHCRNLQDSTFIILFITLSEIDFENVCVVICEYDEYCLRNSEI